MIEYLKGAIVGLTPTNLVIECAGVGYDVNVSLTTYSAYQGKKEGLIWITQLIREDAHLLYGFSTKEERTLFGQLTSVSGVGPTTARLILSSYAPQELAALITTGQTDALKAVKGIGLKTAQRIIVDLKGKIQLETSSDEIQSARTAVGGAALNTIASGEEAISALKMLGFADPAIRKAVKSILSEDSSLAVEDIIKRALRML
ncbi:Holliday junction branch migration protein RuvA [Porphyromonas gulae]|uniref:Holliday junction branch migration protein RuvA n=1 Tax=Porphyromonas gulae TaxID=111105 RepID=UPI0026F2CAEE|nr:Holliday junction branch migration protein RuvA [Porphyromonas gulae]